MPGLVPIPPAGRKGPRRSAFPSRSDAASRSPTPPVGGGFEIGAGNRHRVGVAGRADLAVLIGAGQLDPGLAFVDELTDRLEARTVERVGLCETAEVIEHDRGGNTQQ